MQRTVLAALLVLFCSSWNSKVLQACSTCTRPSMQNEDSTIIWDGVEQTRKGAFYECCLQGRRAKCELLLTNTPYEPAMPYTLLSVDGENVIENIKNKVFGLLSIEEQSAVLREGNVFEFDITINERGEVLLASLRMLRPFTNSISSYTLHQVLAVLSNLRLPASSFVSKNVYEIYRFRLTREATILIKDFSSPFLPFKYNQIMF